MFATASVGSRDLSDRKTIENFSAVVQSLERMKLLTILTTADIRAVGPGVWNGWKGQLLRDLYHEADAVMSGAPAGTVHRIDVAGQATAFAYGSSSSLFGLKRSPYFCARRSHSATFAGPPRAWLFLGPGDRPPTSSAAGRIPRHGWP